jgi:hypothetical protein
MIIKLEIPKRKYNGSMYESLSNYVCNNVGEVKYIDDIKSYETFCLKEPKWSYEYSLPENVTGYGIVEMEKIIKKLMIEWFDANGMDFREFFDDTTSHCEWMVRNIPDTYPYLFHNLLIDIAIEQNIIKNRVE